MLGGGSRPPQRLHHMLGGGWGVSRSTPPSLEAMSACSGAGSDDGEEFEFEEQVCTWLVEKLPTAASLPESLASGFRISYTAFLLCVMS